MSCQPPNFVVSLSCLGEMWYTRVMLKSMVEKALYESLKEYSVSGARSNKKLQYIHGLFADAVMRKLPDGWTAKSQGYGDNKEFRVQGAYLVKNCDITFLKDDIVKGVIEVKLPGRNYKQNANNYFEQAIGATANLRQAGVVVGQVMLLPAELPYFTKEQILTKKEIVGDKDVNKYRLMMQSPSDGSPDDLLFGLYRSGMESSYVIDSMMSTLPEVQESGVKLLSPAEVSRYVNVLNTKFLGEVSRPDMFVDSFAAKLLIA